MGETQFLTYAVYSAERGNNGKTKGFGSFLWRILVYRLFNCKQAFKLWFLTHEDKVQVRSMGWTKFLCVASNFYCFLTNVMVFIVFEQKNRREHALRVSLCPERGSFTGFI